MNSAIEDIEKLWGWKNVYVMKNDIGEVKIGISKNVEQRRNGVASASGHRIVDIHYTKPCSNPREVERRCHMFYKDARLAGEWFKIDFDDAVRNVNSIFEQCAEFIPYCDNGGLEALKRAIQKEFEAKDSFEYVMNISIKQLFTELMQEISDTEDTSLMPKPISPYWKLAELFQMLIHISMRYASYLDSEDRFETRSQVIVDYENGEGFAEDIDLYVNGKKYLS